MEQKQRTYRPTRTLRAQRTYFALKKYRSACPAGIPIDDGGEVLREIVSSTTEVTTSLKANGTCNASSGEPISLPPFSSQHDAKPVPPAGSASVTKQQGSTNFSGLEPRAFHSKCRITAHP